jgi:hypothetical protein
LRLLRRLRLAGPRRLLRRLLLPFLLLRLVPRSGTLACRQPNE